MNKTRLKKIWINESAEGKEIRLDWDNDRHHAVVIRRPERPEDVIFAVHLLLDMLIHEKELGQI